MKKGPYTLVSTSEKYTNPWMRVTESIVKFPSGGDGLFGTIDIKNGVSVLPIDDEGNVYLVKEYKLGVDKYSIEAVSGGIEEGDSAEDTARKELKEEAGIEAAELIHLGSTTPITVYLNFTQQLFIARGLQFGESQPEESEVIEVLKVPFAKAVEMVHSGEIYESMNGLLILKAKEYLEKEKN